MKIGPLQRAMKQLGMAAVLQTVAMAKLTAKPDRDTFEEHLREHMEQLLHAAITYTAQLIYACIGDSRRDLEAHLIAKLHDGHLAYTADFQQSVDGLVVAARTYANRMTELAEHCMETGVTPIDLRADGNEQTYKLACTAVAFTMQLTIATSSDPVAARESARELEQRLTSILNDVFETPKDLS